jgi:hypothetical protein
MVCSYISEYVVYLLLNDNTNKYGRCWETH